jgi:hypothetical protein
LLPVCYCRSLWGLALAAGAIACAAQPIHADEDVLVVQEQAVVAVDVAAAAPMPAPAAAAGDADEDARLAPIRAQYEPLLKSELSFANRICGWSDEQRRAAIKEGVAWLTEFARKQVADQNPVRAGMLAFVGLARPRAPADPAADAEQQIAELIAKQLTTEQQALYKTEHDKRQAFRKQTVIDNLIAKLDEKLDFTAQQRRKLSATLEARWSEDWAPQLEIFVHMGEYVPQIPDEYVIPHLTAEQKKLWNGLQKVSFGRGVNFGQDLFPGGVDDIDLSEAR